MKSLLMTLVLLFFASNSFFSLANFNISNIKELPSYEQYVFESDKTDDPVTMKLTMRVTNKSWAVSIQYRAKDTGYDEHLVIRFSDMQTTSSVRSNYNKSTATVETFSLQTDNIENKDPDTFTLLSYNGLGYLIRTFPFQSPQNKIALKFSENSDSKMSFIVQNNRIIRMNTPALGVTDVYEVETGMNIPLISALIPKSYFYINTNNSRQIVGLKESFSRRGKETVLKLSRYSTNP